LLEEILRTDDAAAKHQAPGCAIENECNGPIEDAAMGRLEGFVISSAL
jgi:hypothetical protein